MPSRPSAAEAPSLLLVFGGAASKPLPFKETKSYRVPPDHEASDIFLKLKSLHIFMLLSGKAQALPSPEDNQLPDNLLCWQDMAKCTQCGRKLPPFSFKNICQWCVQHEAAQRGDIDDVKQHVMPAPWVRSESSITLTQVLFGANVAVFLAMAAASGAVVDFPGQTMAHFGANFGPYTLSGDWWRLVTYMFLHGGLMHIAFNMWCLWDLGALCESLYGRWTFAAVYLTTGIAGGVASIGWNPRVLSVGASGAIFGLAGALIASFYLGEFSLPSIAIRGTLRSLVFFVGFNVLFGSMFPGIDNACHFGGLISGLILGALIARIAPQRQPAPAGQRAGHRCSGGGRGCCGSATLARRAFPHRTSLGVVVREP